jgi:hypothetical protein
MEHFYLYNQYDITVYLFLFSEISVLQIRLHGIFGDEFSSTKNEAGITNCGRKHTKQRKDFQTF